LFDVRSVDEMDNRLNARVGLSFLSWPWPCIVAKYLPKTREGGGKTFQ